MNIAKLVEVIKEREREEWADLYKWLVGSTLIRYIPSLWRPLTRQRADILANAMLLYETRKCWETITEEELDKLEGRKWRQALTSPQHAVNFVLAQLRQESAGTRKKLASKKITFRQTVVERQATRVAGERYQAPIVWRTTTQDGKEVIIPVEVRPIQDDDYNDGGLDGIICRDMIVRYIKGLDKTEKRHLAIGYKGYMSATEDRPLSELMPMSTLKRLSEQARKLGINTELYLESIARIKAA